jgi:ribosomal protein L11 methyltransferase
MPYLQLSLTVQRRGVERVEDALTDLGALSVSLADAHDDAIFEPKPGETPLWPEVRLDALFSADADRRGLALALSELLPWLREEQLAFADIGDADWTRAWMDSYRPMQFGERLAVYPSGHAIAAEDADRVVVRLDPGLAFGSGTHATTALCLAWLDGLDLRDRRVLDFGCGSGILAVAALKLGAAQAHGIDIDPQALIASQSNAEANGVGTALSLAEGSRDADRGAYDVVVANILAGALVELAPLILAGARPGAPIALSGILDGQQDEVIAAYAAACSGLSTRVQDGWVLVHGRVVGA